MVKFGYFFPLSNGFTSNMSPNDCMIKVFCNIKKRWILIVVKKNFK